MDKKRWEEKNMKLYGIPFDGLFIVYECMNGEMIEIFSGFCPEDIPESYRNKNLKRIYPCEDVIIVEI